jgi:nucleoside-diphosphate-sugar epimerase
MWNRRGRFVFTSSTAVYADPSTASEVCTEGSPLKSPLSEHPRAAKLLACEEVCTQAGGTVVRLAGLYHAGRGAHSHFLKQGTLDSNGAALVRPSPMQKGRGRNGVC